VHRRRAGAKALEDLESVETRKAQIQVDEVGSLVGRHAEALVTVVPDHD
jgi:hypothetical protein